MKQIVEIFYNLWCMICLYALAAWYLQFEILRKFNYPNVRHLDIDTDIPKDLSQYTILMTGGSRGIGWEAAKVFLTKGATVIITTSATGDKLRNLHIKLQANCGTLRSTHQLQVKTMDLNSFDSVVSFVSWFKSTHTDLNVLINNAGQMYAPFRLTVDGYESHWQVNYLSHVLLVLLLLPLLKSTAQTSGVKSRIINVASSTHFARNLSLDDVNGLSMYSPYHSYAQSKLAQIMFTYKLASLLNEKSLDEACVTVNSLHPGVALTELYENVWWVKMFPAIAKCLFRVSSLRVDDVSSLTVRTFHSTQTPADGAETVIYCSVSRALENTSGCYYEDLTPVKSSSYSYDTLAQEKLWCLTMKQLEAVVKSHREVDIQV